VVRRIGGLVAPNAVRGLGSEPIVHGFRCAPSFGFSDSELRPIHVFVLLSSILVLSFYLRGYREKDNDNNSLGAFLEVLFYCSNIQQTTLVI